MRFARSYFVTQLQIVSFKNKMPFAFRTIGLVYIVVIIAAIFFIRRPQVAFPTSRLKLPQTGPANKNWKKCYKSNILHHYQHVLCRCLLWFDDCLSSIPIGQSMFGLCFGTALYVSLYSIANSSGRFIWDHSDKIDYGLQTY